MSGYRLTHTAQADIVAILAWSYEQFGEEARKRYETLIATAIRDAASRSDDVGLRPRSELGDGVFSWD
ncbi:type II toxin-antitoxin system RelE/ParE family toxin [Cryobacterium fucosi]|uniref:type II toxin-antitoxin system RelE/ParE family toxin n=1 Tax=Cryobacterium fucosi TaxID=1259157 RepID=UPI001582B83D|nr:type II toxin-antitoxin system RelE/ParE family toxin [Cryobacterium fucosi]